LSPGSLWAVGQISANGPSHGRPRICRSNLADKGIPAHKIQHAEQPETSNQRRAIGRADEKRVIEDPGGVHELGNGLDLGLPLVILTVGDHAYAWHW